MLVLYEPASPTRRVGHTKDLLEEVHAKDLSEEVHAKNLMEEVHADAQESEARSIPEEMVGTETKGAILKV